MSEITNNHLLFLLILIFVFINYRISTIKKKITTETFADASSEPYEQEIKDAVKRMYLCDVEAIRNLSNVAINLSQGGFTVPNVTTAGLITSQQQIKNTGNISTISGYLTSTNGGSIQARTLRQTDIAPNEIAFTSMNTAHYNIKNSADGKLRINDTSSSGGIGTTGSELLTLDKTAAIFGTEVSATSSDINIMWALDLTVNNIESKPATDININSPLVVNTQTNFKDLVTFGDKVNINASVTTNYLYYPGMVGAWICGTKTLPILYSIPNLEKYGVNNNVSYILLLPGFSVKLCVDADFKGTTSMMKNPSDSNNAKFITIPSVVGNQISSIELYYNTMLIPSVVV